MRPSTVPGDRVARSRADTLRRRCTLGALALLVALGCEGRTPAEDQRTEEDFTVRVRGVAFLRFEGGGFTMGRVGEPFAEPPTDVVVRPFQLMKTEVTLGLYLQCVDDGACELPATPPLNRCAHHLLADQAREAVAELPMNCMNWRHAQRFVSWFGQGARLPTEAEWEYAATGGAGRLHPWGAESPTCDRVVRRPDSRDEELAGRCVDWIQPVCSRPAGNTPAPRGLCDMLGNVGELVEDDFHPTYDCSTWVPRWPDDYVCPGHSRLPTDGSPWIEQPRLERVRSWRGVSFGQGPADMRTTIRKASSVDLALEVTGFRLARDDSGEPR
ncbi:MAG: formylglycine-generating enzyme family protein [bacterium]